MKKLLIVFALCSVFACAFGQVITTDHGKQSDEISLKLQKIDLLDQLLPLLLTKDQINNHLLPAIEKARQKEKQILQAEDTELGKMDPEISEVLDKALNKGQYPPKDFLKRVAGETASMSLKRALAATEMTEDISKVIDATFTEGQKKVLENSFDSKFVDPTKKPEDVPASTKRLFFIQRVFLDPLTRELLITLADKASQ